MYMLLYVPTNVELIQINNLDVEYINAKCNWFMNCYCWFVEGNLQIKCLLQKLQNS